MKHLFFTLFVLIGLAACNNDDDKGTPINQLPAATQTGENTFGCLLDGEVFLPGRTPNPLDCTYQFVDGDYYFGLQGNRRNADGDLIRIGLVTQDLEIEENQTYILTKHDFGNASGAYFFITSFNYTSEIHTGELTITKLDTQTQIVSGTFWFDVQDSEGVVHQIREGRFDMQYTR